jgi:Circadian oscillating protein COP23
MKRHPAFLYLMVRAVSAIAWIVLGQIPPAISTPNTLFYCGLSPQGVPTTYAKTTSQEVPLIRWVSTHFQDYTPTQRCQEVSGRFQSAYRNGSLKYITVGIQNQQPIVCTSRNGNGCDQRLFTLNPGTNPAQVVQHLNNLRIGYASTEPLNESVRAEQPHITAAIEIQQILNSAPTEIGIPFSK